MDDDPGFTVSKNMIVGDVTKSKATTRHAECQRIVEILEEAGITFWRDPDDNAYAAFGNSNTTPPCLVHNNRFECEVRRVVKQTVSAQSKGAKRHYSVSTATMREVVQMCKALALEAPGPRARRADR